MNELEVRYRFPGQKFLIGLAALFVVGAGLKASQSFIVPILFALFLAILGAPAAAYLKEKGLPRIIAVLLVAIVFVFGLLGLGYLFYSSLAEFRSALPRYQGRLQGLNTDLQLLLSSYGFEYSNSEIFGAVDARAVIDFVGSTLKGILGALSIVIVVLIMMIFMLYEATEFKKKLAISMGQAFQEEKFNGMALDMQRYLGIKTVTSFITGVIVGLFNYVMGVDFWLLWGLLAFLLNYIPFVGSIIAAVPAVLLAFMEGGSGTGIIVMAGYFAINNIVSSVLEPILLGPRLGLSPLIVFLSLVVWGWLWGPAGMLLSVPLTMVVKILLEHSEEFRWVAILMSHGVTSAKKVKA